MNKDLADASRKEYAQNMFDLVWKSYHKVNKDYLRKQIAIASEYLTEEQKEGFRQRRYLEATCVT